MTNACQDKPEWQSGTPDGVVPISGIGSVSLSYAERGCSVFDESGSPVDPYAELAAGSSQSDSEFLELLKSWVANLNYFSVTYGGYQPIARIIHGGIYPAGDQRRTFHQTGEAIDVKGIDWGEGSSKAVSRPCAGNSETMLSDGESINWSRYRRLVGVEASLRKFFGVVIGRGDASHADHFHADIECPVSFSTASADKRLFARDCIIAFTGNSLSVEHNAAAWSQSSDQASLNSLLAALGMHCFSIENSISEYLIFLDYIMMHAFANRAAGHFRWGGLVDL